MLQKARELSGAQVWFLTVRVAEVGVAALLVGALIEARSAWALGAQYTGQSGLGSGVPTVSLMQRIIGMALFGGYRAPVSVLVVAVSLAGLLVVLHRCQPVSHTRYLRWEWLVLWAVAALLSLVASAICIIALFGDNPYASTDPGVISGSIGPGYHEQVIGNLSWPLGALLLLAPLGLWWARLPDMDDLEDSLAGLLAGVPEGSASDVGTPRTVAVTEHGEVGRPAGPVIPTVRTGRFPNLKVPRASRSARPVRGGDGDSIFVDEVEQIEPVERLQPRESDSGDGSTASGYDGYFRR